MFVNLKYQTSKTCKFELSTRTLSLKGPHDLVAYQTSLQRIGFFKSAGCVGLVGQVVGNCTKKGFAV